MKTPTLSQPATLIEYYQKNPLSLKNLKPKERRLLRDITRGINSSEQSENYWRAINILRTKAKKSHDSLLWVASCVHSRLKTKLLRK